MTLETRKRPLQLALGRPQCVKPCTLLVGHEGKCTAPNGKQWKPRGEKA